MEVLDEIKKKRNNKKTFSILSLVSGMVTISLFLLLFTYIPSSYKATESLSLAPPPLLINSLRISCIAGLFMTFLSFINKEPPSIPKHVGAALNFLCFIAIFLSLLFAVFVNMDL